MKKILLVAFLSMLAVSGCSSLEVETGNTEKLNIKISKLEEYNSGINEKIKAYKNRVETLKKEISSAENDLYSIKKLAGQYATVEAFSNDLPLSVTFEKQYPGELPSQISYVFVKGQEINLREAPTTLSKIISKAVYFDKLTLIEEVINRSGQRWYKVLDKKGQEVFVYSKIVEKRGFQFDEMLYKLNEMDTFISEEINSGNKIASIHAYIPNPNNEDLKREEDKYGNVEDQSAVAIHESGYIYIPDRTIVSVIAKGEEMSEIRVPNVSEEPLFVKNEFIVYTPQIQSSPNKAIVVDAENQNLGVFQRINDKWTLISYNYSKTGALKKLGFKTPKGSFIIPNALKTMLYKNEDGEKQGYANYAIRFSGGGYIHATPFNYDKDEEKQRYWSEYSLGTYRGTRKCIRNNVNHAEFLFNWVLDGKITDKNFQGVRSNAAVIVM